MKLLYAASFLFAVTAGGCKAPSAGAPAPAADAKAAPSPRELIAGGALTIDVRSQGEWDGGHLASAKLLPVDELGGRIGEVEAWAGGDKTKPVVVYCRSGNRSGRAKAMLEQAGFTNVVNGGGYSDLR